jgi:hypothetical protein
VRGSILPLAALVVVAGSACGGTSEEDKARDVVEEYAAAIADGDERRVCATLSKESKARFKRTKSTCVDAYKDFGKFLREEQKDKLRDLDPRIQIDGERATTKIEQPPLQGDLRLNRENGEWKISTQ